MLGLPVPMARGQKLTFTSYMHFLSDPAYMPLPQLPYRHHFYVFLI